MFAVNVGIGHNNNTAVTELCYIEFFAYACTECSYNRHELFVIINLINSCLFNVKHLTPESKNSLECTVSALFCRTARRVTLDDIDFGLCCILFVTVGKLTGKTCTVCNRLTLSFHSSLSRVTSSLCVYSLCNDDIGCFGMLFEIICELFGNDFINDRSNFGITEFTLCLTFEFTFGKLYGDNSIDSFSYSFAGKSNEFLLFFLALLCLLRLFIGVGFLVSLNEVVYDFIEGSLKGNLVCTAVDGMDVVCEGAEGFAVEVCVVLESDFNGNIVNYAFEIDNVGMENVRTTHFLKPLNVAYDTALVFKAFVFFILGITCIRKINKNTAV